MVTDASDGMMPGERRELRSVVKGQFKVLRAEVKRREQEMKAEAEAQLLERYRDEDSAIGSARDEIAKIQADALRQVAEVGQRLREAYPDLTVQAGMGYRGFELVAANGKRNQLHKAILAAIPNKVGDANLTLDRQENDLLRVLSVGALQTSEARAYLDTIPTVGELIPAVRLKELEASFDLDGSS